MAVSANGILVPGQHIPSAFYTETQKYLLYAHMSVVSYVDTGAYFEPEDLKKHLVRELLKSTIDWTRRRGFLKMYIWSCPPALEDSYIFFGNALWRGKAFSPQQLCGWYKTVLRYVWRTEGHSRSPDKSPTMKKRSLSDVPYRAPPRLCKTHVRSTTFQLEMNELTGSPSYVKNEVTAGHVLIDVDVKLAFMLRLGRGRCGRVAIGFFQGLLRWGDIRRCRRNWCVSWCSLAQYDLDRPGIKHDFPRMSRAFTVLKTGQAFETPSCLRLQRTRTVRCGEGSDKLPRRALRRDCGHRRRPHAFVDTCGEQRCTPRGEQSLPAWQHRTLSP